MRRAIPVAPIQRSPFAAFSMFDALGCTGVDESVAEDAATGGTLGGAAAAGVAAGAAFLVSVVAVACGAALGVAAAYSLKYSMLDLCLRSAIVLATVSRVRCVASNCRIAGCAVFSSTGAAWDAATRST